MIIFSNLKVDGLSVFRYFDVVGAFCTLLVAESQRDGVSACNPLVAEVYRAFLKRYTCLKMVSMSPKGDGVLYASGRVCVPRVSNS